MCQENQAKVDDEDDGDDNDGDDDDQVIMMVTMIMMMIMMMTVTPILIRLIALPIIQLPFSHPQLVFEGFIILIP